jgi:hypothetical protein
MRWLTIALLLIVEISIIIVSILIRPDRIGELDFWLIVIWLLFLVFLNWFVSAYTFGKAGDANKSTQFGILPSLNILVFVYSVASVSFLIFSWNITDFGILPNWHMITQVIAAAVTAFVGILMLIAAKGAEIGTPDGLKPKEDFVKKINILSSSLPKGNSELESELKKLCDYIQYSMPHIARINNIENYNLLYSQLHELDLLNEDESENLKSIIKLIVLAKSC